MMKQLLARINVFHRLREAEQALRISRQERTAAEAANRRLTQLYATLCACDRTIGRCASADELFPMICRDLVEIGGLQMAWVGLVDEASQAVRPVACYGTGMDYLTDIRISTMADDASGQGPVGTSIREGQPVWCHDFQSSTSTAVWHERGAKYGWSTLAALPLVTHGKPVGSINLYDGRNDAFGDDMRHLLVEMAGNISFALENFSNKAGRDQALEALRASEDRFRALFFNAPLGYQSLDEEGRFIEVNQAWLDTLGYQREEVLGRWFGEFLAPEFVEAFRKRFPLFKAAGQIHSEFKMLHKDGRKRFMAFDGRIGYHPSGEFKQTHCILADITERRLAEIELSKTKAVLQAAMDQSPAGIAIADAPSGTLRYVNRAGLLIRGASEAEVVNGVDINQYVSSWKLLHLDGTPMETEEVPLARAVLFGEPCIKEFMIRRSEQEDRIVLANAAPIFNPHGQVQAGIAVFQDITERKQAEEKLRETNAYLENLFNGANAPIIVWDAAGRITRFNHSFEAVAGVTKEQVLGRSLEFLFAHDQRARAMGLVKRASEGERFTLIEVPIRHANGSQRTVLWNSAPIYDVAGTKQVATIAQGHDITERKQTEDALRASEERFRRAVVDAPFPIMLHAEDGVILQVSNAVCEITGYSHEELATIADWTDLAYGERKSLVQPDIDRLYSLDDHESEGDYSIRTKSGAVRIWDFSSAPLGRLPDGRRLVISMAMDVTERRAAENEVRLLNAELEQRVASRTAQLEEANKELEAFSYSVSHDLRAPLRAIAGFGGILLEDHAVGLDPEGRRLLDVIAKETRRMGQLIDDLLAFSRISRQALDSASINMTAMVQSVFEEQSAPNPQRIVQLELKPLPPARGDVAMMRVVWVNLLSNAVKFIARRERAVIEVASFPQDGQMVYSVKDNGVGFDMTYANKLFGVFQRLHTQNEFEGTGVGLALVQQIIQRHGGRVWAESQVNQGATFYFALPTGQQTPGA